MDAVASLDISSVECSNQLSFFHGQLCVFFPLHILSFFQKTCKFDLTCLLVHRRTPLWVPRLVGVLRWWMVSVFLFFPSLFPTSLFESALIPLFCLSVASFTVGSHLLSSLSLSVFSFSVFSRPNCVKQNKHKTDHVSTKKTKRVSTHKT